ncbi:hypothetical protein P4O66_004557 [Electrophorus voltai]|uniref:Uncharacterized protein n=1 Tax=Electrophorus voltai TaxID=2609070 RepID=A0AAD8ZMK2_9TELE|nr:hypothetical protein P4O66_004557 [Electrophorus voltai]
MLGKGAQCARALRRFLMLARFPQGLFLASHQLFSLGISVGHLGFGVRDGMREKGCGDSGKSEKSEEDSGKSEKSEEDSEKSKKSASRMANTNQRLIRWSRILQGST